MNCTLIKLVWTMWAATTLTKYLWEEATAHVAYLRNQSYTTLVKGSTPYQKWHGTRPNVTHLQEFRAPIWVLLQGQKVLWKMLPKSQRWSFVRFDDGLKSVKYYSGETRKILTSRNFHFLTLPGTQTPPEKIEITPNTLCEGELRVDTWSARL